MPRAPRLVFGEVAELYDRVRPSYPDALVDDVVELAGAGNGARDAPLAALEVGAGTGKATVMFAQRGVTVHALEPSAAMAAIARRKCSRYEAVTIEEIDFERWRSPDAPFELKGGFRPRSRPDAPWQRDRAGPLGGLGRRDRRVRWARAARGALL